MSCEVAITEAKISSQPAGALFDFLLDASGGFTLARKLLFGKEIGVVSVGMSTVELLVARNGASFGIAYPFGPTHFNVKNLAAIAYGWSREVGMSEALKRAGLPLEGTHHRGGDDAWNIAGLLCHLLRSIRWR
jgi:hypothetical protein